jgi:hypothetical protein
VREERRDELEVSRLLMVVTIEGTGGLGEDERKVEAKEARDDPAVFETKGDSKTDHDDIIQNKKRRQNGTRRFKTSL